MSFFTVVGVNIETSLDLFNFSYIVWVFFAMPGRNNGRQVHKCCDTQVFLSVLL